VSPYTRLVRKVAASVEQADGGALVLLADPDLRFLGALEAVLRRQRLRPERVGEWESCAALVMRLRPDAVVLVDRDGRGAPAGVLRAVRAWSDTPVLVILRARGMSEELRYFRLGADDVVWLPVSPRVVAARVTRLVRRAGARGQPTVRRLGELEVDLYSNGASVAGRELHLTPVEYRLLVVLAGAPGRAFSRSELIEGAAPESDALERTVDAHVCSLRRKLALAGAGGQVQTVRGVGYRLVAGVPAFPVAGGAVR